MCLKLSNPGDSLKTIIPNFHRKVYHRDMVNSHFLDRFIFFIYKIKIEVAELITQIFLYLFNCWKKNKVKKNKVKSYSMIESEMGNRGTKSHSVRNSVKAQRVDGSWVTPNNIKKGTLRCTLMGFERSYQTRILSKQINNLFFSTFITKLSQARSENPYFVTGFCDAESSFQISVIKTKNSKIGWSVRSLFTIGLHSRDLELLLNIKDFFGCGIIVKNKTLNEVSFRVNSLQDLTIKIILAPPLIFQITRFWLKKQLIFYYLNKLQNWCKIKLILLWRAYKK